MKRRLFLAFASGLLLLAAADSAQAQRYGRWGGGSGYYRPYVGYGYGGSISPYYGYGGSVSPYFGTYGNYGSYYTPYIGGYSGYPYSGYGRGYSYGIYGATPSSIEYGVPAASIATTPSIGSSQSFYSGSASDGNTLRFHVVVPKADAQLWIEGMPMKQVGLERDFISPPVERDKNYLYTFRAKWTDNGREVTRDKEVKARVGQPAEIRFE